MEPNDENLQLLAGVLSATLSHLKSDRDKAIEWLLTNGGVPGITVCLIAMMRNENLEMHLRSSAAANLYGLLQKSWTPDDSPYPVISDDDKRYCKQVIVDSMLSVPKSLYKMVSGCLQTIAEHEFPHQWPELLPNLVQRLQSDDPTAVIGILKTLNSVLKFYRGKPKTTGYVSDLLLVLKDFQDPLKEMFMLYTQQFESYQGNEEVLAILLRTIKIMFEIFHSLISIDLPQFFVDSLEYWMATMKRFLNYQLHPDRLEYDENETMMASPSHTAKLQATIIRILTLFARKYDEDFEPYAYDFVKDVWDLLSKIAQVPQECQIHFDSLVIEALNFICTSVAGSSFYKIFEQDGIIQSMCNDIILPNIRLTDQLIGQFQDEAIEYIRTDFEGSDSYTRRRSAIELVKGIRKHFESQVTAILSDTISNLLAAYSSNPAENWYLKDQAIYLVMALTLTASSRTKGALTVNPLVPLVDFFSGSILPELASGISEGDVPTLIASKDQQQSQTIELIRADCLRFVITFRLHIPSQYYLQLMQIFNAYLNSPSIVVSSYAAIGLDSFMSMKDENVRRMDVSILSDNLIGSLFTNMFGRVNSSQDRFESESPYIGMAIARLISCIRVESIIPMASNILDALTSKLSLIYQNPTNSMFVHFLFEGIAGVLGSLLQASHPELCESAEKQLLPAFDTIIQDDIMDLTPYVYQIMAQLIESRKGDPQALVAKYGEKFVGFTTAQHWERFGNIPALTRLMCAYISYAPGFVSDKLFPLLGIFGRVNSLKTTVDVQALKLVSCILLHMDPSVYQSQVTAIFDHIYTKLKGSGNLFNYQNQFLLLAAQLCYVEHLGPSFFIQASESVSQGIFNVVLSDLLIKYLPRTPDARTAAVGMACLLTSPVFLQDYMDHFVPLLSSLINLLCGTGRQSSEESSRLSELTASSSTNAPNGEPGSAALNKEQAQLGYTTDFSQLHFSGKSQDSIVPRDINAKVFLCHKLNELGNQLGEQQVQHLISQLGNEQRDALVNSIMQSH